METPCAATFNSENFYTPVRIIPTFLRDKKKTIVDRHIVDGVCLERVEASGRSAVVYRRNTNIFFRRYNVDFDILNAVYVTFMANQPAKAEVHLCLVGERRIDFHELTHEGHCMLTLPFKICMAHKCGFGLMLERDCFSDACETEPDSAQLFSLTHPYNEFFPIVCKFKADAQCYYAFRGRRIALIPNSWHVDSVERAEVVTGYDLDARRQSRFLLRRCTMEEKRSVKKEMWMDARGFFNISLQSPAVSTTAAVSARSFYSPNILSASNFPTSVRSSIVAPTLISAAPENISPLTTQSNSFTSLGAVRRGSFGAMMEDGGSAPTSSSRITPTRRHCMQTRSMVSANVNSVPPTSASTTIADGNRSATSLGASAARNISDFAFVEGPSFLNRTSSAITTSMASSTDLSSFTRRRSMNTNTLLQFALTQQRRLRCTSTPIADDLDTERLLALSKSNSMECAVEYCLEWLGDVREPKAPSEISMECMTIATTTTKSTAATAAGIVGDVVESTSQTAAAVSLLPETAKKPPGVSAPVPDRRVRQRRLQMLDDLFLSKSADKCNTIHAWKLRESSANMLASEEAKYCRQRWGDNRLQNVRQMLDSSKAVLIPSKLDALIESGDMSPLSSQDERAQRLHFVTITALKTVTRPFGQALLNFATVRPISNQPVVMNPICLDGRVSPNGARVEYPTNEPNYKAFIEWASFYNGVAHGLAVLGFDGFTRHCSRRLRKQSDKAQAKRQIRQNLSGNSPSLTSFSATCRRRQSILSDYSLGSPTTIDSDATQATQFAEELANFSRELRQPNSTRVVLDWDWLNMNLQAHRDIPPVEAGFLFAAGLSGRIPISNHDVYNYVANYKNKFCVMAILLGWAVAHRGTSDIVVHKVLITHSPFLMQPTLCDFRFEPMIQTAALVGLGFLFAETMNLSLSSQLINQMSRETFDTEQGVADRYSFVLAAGFAIGLINLGKGAIIAETQPPVVNAHLSLAERLLKLLNGEDRRMSYVHYDRISQCSHETTSFIDAAEGGGGLMRRYADGTTTAGDGLPLFGGCGDSAELNSTSNHVRQMRKVNIHLTSPAACAALALMYLRTNDVWISDALSIPNTISAIERIRPDVLMLRVLAKCLVNFDAIEGTMRFVEAQIPSIIRRYAAHYVNNCRKGGKERETWWSRVVDMNCVAQAYFYCSAGACLAIALRYASTSYSTARHTIESFYGRIEGDEFLVDENNAINVFRHLSALAGRNCVNACINISTISLALIMAGSGDLATLKLLRKMRNLRRPESASGATASTSTLTSQTSRNAALHSLHTSANMAIGMLCLGNGRLSLAKTNMSIASLFISTFPVFPHSLLDNRAYLQPLRFLWTLAVETRFLTTVDAETLAPITISIRVTFKSENQAPLVGWTPFILPALNQIATISLADQSISSMAGGRSGALFDYAPVELCMRKTCDARKLRDVLNRCYGRLPMRKKTTSADDTIRLEDFTDLDNLIVQSIDMLASKTSTVDDDPLSDDQEMLDDE